MLGHTINNWPAGKTLLLLNPYTLFFFFLIVYALRLLKQYNKTKAIFTSTIFQKTNNTISGGSNLILMYNSLTKYRLIYFINNWVFSTNHKRLSINYLFFVLFSGLIGSVLATLIRLELAYPNIGIFVGDSLQYLSLATSHGVVMVFFMIIPLIFGSFGNFLIPTQLGVHDVAFPRLNSAAFWFLPSGLFILGHLICTDKRYYRLNFFNFKELETLFKKKFSFDCYSIFQKNELLQDSAFKLNYFKFYSYTQFSTDFFNFASFFNNDSTFFLNNRPVKKFERLINVAIGSLNNFSFYFKNLFTLFLYQSSNLSLYTESSSSFFNSMYSFFNLNLSDDISQAVKYDRTMVLKKNNEVSSGTDFFFFGKYENLARSLEFQDYNIKYDFKFGNFFNKEKSEFFNFTNLQIPVSSVLKQNIWFYYNFFNFDSSIFDLNKSTFSLNFFFLSFFNIFDLNIIKNVRWVNIKYLFNQKNSLFMTNNIQHRLVNNWRFLKFNREVWRSKLLLTRNQNSLYFFLEKSNTLLWSIERNVKDLLPGWAMITPFSTRFRFTAVGKVDVGLVSIFFAINASIVSSLNFIITYKYLATIGNKKMRDSRCFFTEASLTASWMMVLANPMLAIAIIMVLFDRHLKTSFFDYSGGGDAILFQHMFWFFGHPEVYIVVLPVFGFTNTILCFFLRKRISARTSLLYSLYTIAFLGFFVWGHHMYMVGLSHTTRMLFSTLTVMISVPAATKLMHWCVTLVNSFFCFEIAFIFTLFFIFFFISGGISGMWVAHTGMDVLFHDTFYVIGHFHVMFAGAAMLGNFAAFYFYFYSLFGVKYNRFFAYNHFIYFLLGQLITLIPMFWLGYSGMPRRVLDYPYIFGGWHSIITSGHFIIISGLMSFCFLFFESLRQSKPFLKNNFGIIYFNTRLSFYLFEINKLGYINLLNVYNFSKIKNNFRNFKIFIFFFNRNYLNNFFFFIFFL